MVSVASWGQFQKQKEILATSLSPSWLEISLSTFRDGQIGKVEEQSLGERADEKLSK
jgi:hypothetical protein